MSGTALLVGSSFSAIPLFFALKRRGLRVEVCGNLPGDPCHQYADASHAIDYSDREALLAVARGGRFDYLVPSCNDYAYLASTWVAAQLGFPGFDPVDMAMMMHTKHRFRAFAEAAGVCAWRRAGCPSWGVCVRRISSNRSTASAVVG